MVAMAIHFVVGMLADVPFAQGFAASMLIISTGCGVAAVTFHRGFAVSALIYASGFVAMSFAPSHGILLFGIGQVLGFVSMSWLWWYAAKKEGQAEP